LNPSRHPLVVVSNGFNKFHLSVAAAEIHARGQLIFLVTGAYPTRWFERTLTHLPFLQRSRLHRLVDRREALPQDLVHPLALPELLCELAILLGRLRSMQGIAQHGISLSYKLYGWLAGRQLSEIATDRPIFHYRAAFGHSSVETAKRLGFVALCDHSIAHPAALPRLTLDRAAPPRLQTEDESADPLVEPVMAASLADIEQADFVIVNSDFVKRTFVDQGYPADRVRVVYWGLDDNFLARLPPATSGSTAAGREVRLLFVGSFNRRKGATVLLSALERLASRTESRWHLSIAGPMSADVRTMARRVVSDLPVELLGAVSRSEVARLMVEADVFVFPSFAEGSARVVFEALACGCFIITTPNAGSIVEHGAHGLLVPPGDSEALADALVEAIQAGDSLRAIGRANAAVVKARYRQSDYGEALSRLYLELSTAGPADPPDPTLQRHKSSA
jgi:glycosyltransferase involved in cell wall biosynthesis